MKIKGTPKEIAEFVVEVQTQLKKAKTTDIEFIDFYLGDLKIGKIPRKISDKAL